MYNWQYKSWPQFKYEIDENDSVFKEVMVKSSFLNGVLSALPKFKGDSSVTEQMLEEAMTTSAIEGEYLKRSDVASSIKKNLGIAVPDNIRDKRAYGIGKMMVLSANQWNQKMSQKQLFEWHKALMHGNKYINAGVWRKGTSPMQVVSGPIGREIVHFEAPPSSKVSEEMKAFIKWYNDSAPNGKTPINDPAIRSAIAHLYFESIHPFEDGNGRIGRAIAERAFHQTIGMRSLLSISTILYKKQEEYYSSLNSAQQGGAIENWIYFFTNCISEALDLSKKTMEYTVDRVHFYDRIQGKINKRQEKVLNKMTDEGLNWKGGMNAKKYMSINKVSKATATRDLQDLVQKEIFKPIGGGRSTSYEILLY